MGLPKYFALPHERQVVGAVDNRFEPCKPIMVSAACRMRASVNYPILACSVCKSDFAELFRTRLVSGNSIIPTCRKQTFPAYLFS